MEKIIKNDTTFLKRDYSALYLLFDIPFTCTVLFTGNLFFFLILTYIASPVLLLVLVFKTKIKLSKSLTNMFQFMSRTFLVITLAYFFLKFDQVFTIEKLLQPQNPNLMTSSDTDSIFALSLIIFLALTIWTSIANIFKCLWIILNKCRNKFST